MRAQSSRVGQPQPEPKSRLTASKLFFVIDGAGLVLMVIGYLAFVGKGEAVTLTSTPYKLARLANDLDSMKSPEAIWRRAMNRLKAKAVW